MKKQDTKQRKKRKTKALLIVICVLTVMGIAAAVVAGKAKEADASAKYIDDRPPLDVQLLPVNRYSRPGTELKQVKGIVVHYTANPGTSAKQNRDYFAGLAKSHKTFASSHFVIGLEGEMIQCIPCQEIAYASNGRNKDTISIECCIEDETGKFNDKTYQSLVELVSWLMGRYGLTTDDVIRHYDVTGKNCPKYFVEHPGEWEKFKEDLNNYIEENGVDKNSEIH